MLFNSVEFIFLFLPITILLFFVTARLSNTLALFTMAAASLIFYMQNDWKLALIFVPSIIFNYFLGLIIHNLGQTGDHRLKTVVLVIALACNLFALAYYKYLDFSIRTLNWIGLTSFPEINTVLPIGISFFTFTQIAFLVDAYQGKVKEAKPVKYALFVSYFPHLVAGPVLHHNEMMPQFSKHEIFRPHAENFSVGLTIFVIGLFKKAVLADSLAPYVKVIFDASAKGVPLTTLEAWSGASFYTLQIYFDFSGYSDMAIGLSRLFGVILPLNFNSPYKAVNIIDFWRRWHITLSRFLRDYLYIPLGGNRHGTIRRLSNLMIVMVLGGLWHGAGWTFVIWGALHGFYLLVNHLWHLVFGVGHGTRVGRTASTLLTFALVIFAWVFFRAPDVSAAVILVKGMLGMNGTLLPISLTATGWVSHVIGNSATAAVPAALLPSAQLSLLAAGLLLVAWFCPNTQQIMENYKPALVLSPGHAPRFLQWSPNWITAMLAGALGMSSLFIIVYTKRVGDFIYFQF